MQILEVINEILSTPAILVGLVALIGLVLQKKPIEDVIKGTTKTVVGFLIIGAGAGFLLDGSLKEFGVMFNFAFGMQGVVPNNEAIVTLGLETFAKETALIMAFGMLANLVIARFSNLKYIFLTGHHTLYMAALLAVVLNVGGLSGIYLIAAGSLILGFTMAFFPAIVQPTMRKITGTDELAFGHFGSFGYWFAARIGRLTGKGSKSTEEINFPKRLAFMRDTTVAIALTMIVFFIIVTAVAVMKPNFDVKILKGSHWFIWSLIKGFNFAGGVFIVLSGVRLVVGEIVPAFRGIADKLVPNAKPALDCPVVYPYAPNAVLIGFITSFVGGIVGLFILFGINRALVPVALILPGVIPHFFCGATAGVFANKEGGIRGCLIGSFAHGMLITFLPALLMPVLGALNFASTTFSDADFTLVGIILGNVAHFTNGTILFAFAVVIFMLPIVYAQIKNVTKR
ncbi:MAG: PTS ascorbate transporter subunit IIC [Culicoidibacterales bacterium]